MAIVNDIGNTKPPQDPPNAPIQPVQITQLSDTGSDLPILMILIPAAILIASAVFLL